MNRLASTLVSAALTVGVLQFVAPADASAAVRLGRLAPSGPIRCSGNQRLHLSHRLIDSRGQLAILVRGNCQLTITRSHIISQRMAIRVEGNGRVRLRRTIVDGRPAIWVGHNAMVVARRAEIHGAVIRRHHGRFRRRGSVMVSASRTSVRVGGVRVGPGGVVAPGVRVGAGGVVSPGARVGVGGTVAAPGVRVAPGSVRAPGVRLDARGVATPGATVRVAGGRRAPLSGGAVPAGLTRMAPIRCGGSQNIVLRNCYISTPGPAIISRGNCDVKVIHCTIISSGVAIIARGNGDVVIRRSTVRGRRGAVLVRGNGDVAARNSTFVGGVKRRGNGDFKNRGGNRLH